MIVLLYRGVTAVGRLTVVLWVGMLVTVFGIIATGLMNFHAGVAFDFPPNAFTFSTGFVTGLGSAMLIAMYDFMGYYSICYVGGEVRNPARVIPRSIVYSVLAVAGIYSLMNLSIIGVIPWREAVQSKFIAAQFIEKLYGTQGSGGSHGAGAVDRVRLGLRAAPGLQPHPVCRRRQRPLLSGVRTPPPDGEVSACLPAGHGPLSIGAAFWNLDTVISALLTSRILIQFIGQIFALRYLRKHRQDIVRPFRMWLYPIPGIIALLGWIYIFVTSGWVFVGFGLLTLVFGIAAYVIWKRFSRAC